MSKKEMNKVERRELNELELEYVSGSSGFLTRVRTTGSRCAELLKLLF